MKLSDYLDKIASALERVTRDSKAKRVETFVPELREIETRKVLAELILAVFERWGVHRFNQPVLLGLDEISALRDGKPLPDDVAVLERAGHLLAIDRALLKLYPDSPVTRERWISTPHPQLGHKSALELMLIGGLQAIKDVRAMLEEEIAAQRLR
ncbi:MAG: antitoxin Xre/MbcA/ParS toxin-binding domain-containing protein [Pseudomonadota bacterium]